MIAETTLIPVIADTSQPHVHLGIAPVLMHDIRARTAPVHMHDIGVRG